MPWFVRGDIDGFFGLALDNLVQLLVIVSLCQGVLGFSSDLIYAHILPGVAVSLLIGNLYYAWQAKRLSLSENRIDVCALPYGVNTVSLFAFVFLVMLPAKLAATATGAEDPNYIAWLAGLMACFSNGLIELLGAFIADKLRAITPRAALLSTLAGIALGFISMGYFFRAYSNPIVGLSAFSVILLSYFGKVRFKGKLPGGLVSVVLGSALAWMIGTAPTEIKPLSTGWHGPVPVLFDLLKSLRPDLILEFLSVILPMGLFNLLGSLQNIESAEAAGDRFSTKESLVINGIGSIAACLFGSCFPTTIYIGHPGWKALGARAGYSILNALFMSFVCLSGTLSYIAWAIPIDAGLAIVLWISIVITAQAFQATPSHHAPAVVIGLLPGIAAWGAFMAKSGLHAAGFGSSNGPAFSASLIESFKETGIWIHGAFALEQGSIFTSVLLASICVTIIEKKFIQAALWSWTAALLALAGLVHSYRFIQADTVLLLEPAWPWFYAYVMMGFIFFAANWLTEPAPNSP